MFPKCSIFLKSSKGSELPRASPKFPRSFPDVLQFGGQPTPPTMRPFLASSSGRPSWPAALRDKNGFPGSRCMLRNAFFGDFVYPMALQPSTNSPSSTRNELSTSSFFRHPRQRFPQALPKAVLKSWVACAACGSIFSNRKNLRRV